MKKAGNVYITLWFDTEDYILPQSDDAAKRVADLLTRLGVRATFKVVGEKARTLERRGRTDVIAALQKHEIGYHSDTHSQHPTPAEYIEPLDWDTGVREFTRREKPGFEDVKRIFGQAPTCYGQPGSSWASQSYAALKDWGVGVYLDESNQVGLDGKPFYYGGLLNIFNTREGGQLRANSDWSNLADAKAKFQGFHKTMTANGGGIISIFYHPCEWVHKEFWDGVNFAKGANPPREEWKLPPMQTAAEQERRYKILEDLVSNLKSYPNVRFVTASEAQELYADKAQGRLFEPKEIAEIARGVREKVDYQVRGDYALSPSEVFTLLNTYVAIWVGNGDGQVRLAGTPYGPGSPSRSMTQTGEFSWNQFRRTAIDVEQYLMRHKQLPNEVFLGSTPVRPESYLRALAQVVIDWSERKETPKSAKLLPATLSTEHVAEDSPKLWGWVIFPEGFRAPNLMAIAKLQSWTLKPAILHP